MKSFTFLIITTLLSFSLTAQNSGNELFDNNYLHEVRFDFEQSNFENQLSSNYDNFSESMNVPYILASVSIDGELVDSVGVRYKGFTSYSPEFDKQPIKLDFNVYVDGQRYDGLRKLNLNNGFGDAAMQRDALCYKMLREMGVDAPRTAYAKVYFNDNYHGLYLLVEQVDKEFVQNNFSNVEGNLFKNLGWSEFEWLGNSKQPYADIFELKTNRVDDDWSGFINLMDIINNGSDEEFAMMIPEVFNVDLFLKNLVIDVATNNWDSFIEHGRNWYLYEDTEKEPGKFHWIPWDYNFALGGNFFDFENEDLCDVFPNFFGLTNGTTTIEFVDVSFGVSSTTAYSWDFGDGNNSEEINPIHTYEQPGNYQVCLTLSDGPDCEETQCLPLNTEDNLGNCNSVIDGSFPHAIDPAFAVVIDFTPQCCEEWTDICEEEYLFWNQIFSGEFDFGFSSDDFPIDQSESSKLVINRLLSMDSYRERYYDLHCHLLKHVMVKDKVQDYIDGNHELIVTAVAEDQNFLTSMELFDEDMGDEGLKKYLADRIDSLNLEIKTLHDCKVFSSIPAGEVVINELVASNDSIGGQADPDGGYPDWIELYNTSAMEVDLTGAFISDDETNLIKWQFPDGTRIAADGYLILWADNDEEQTGIHVNFKLKKGGETLYLSDANGDLVDSVEYDEQRTNVAFARVPNGTGDFRFWTTTFASSNDGGMSSTVDKTFAEALSVYPNPASKFITVELENAEHQQDNLLELYDVTGQLLVQEVMDKKAVIDLQSYNAGFYTLILTSARGMRAERKVVVGR